MGPFISTSPGQAIRLLAFAVQNTCQLLCVGATDGLDDVHDTEPGVCSMAVSPLARSVGPGEGGAGGDLQ